MAVRAKQVPSQLTECSGQFLHLLLVSFIRSVVYLFAISHISIQLVLPSKWPIFTGNAWQNLKLKSASTKPGCTLEHIFFFAPPGIGWISFMHSGYKITNSPSKRKLQCQLFFLHSKRLSKNFFKGIVC